jgi:hypothetical protein
LYHDIALSFSLTLASPAKSINQNRVSSIGEGAYLAADSELAGRSGGRGLPFIALFYDSAPSAEVVGYQIRYGGVVTNGVWVRSIYVCNRLMLPNL